MKNIAKKFNCETFIYKIQKEKLNTLLLPAILYWKNNHFLLLEKIRHKKYFIYDPAEGKIILEEDQLERFFSKIAIEIKPNKVFSPKKIRNEFRILTLINKIPKFNKTLSALLISTFFLQISTLISPKYIQNTIDHLSANYTERMIFSLALYFAILKSIEVLINYFRLQTINHFTFVFNKILGSHLFSHLLQLPVIFFQKRHLYDLLSRFNSLDKIRYVISNSLVEGIVGSLLSISSLAIMIIYNFKMSFVSLGATSIYLIARLITLHPFLMKQTHNIYCNSKQNSELMESLRGIQSLKLFSKENIKKQRWGSRYKSYLNSSKDIISYQNRLLSLKNLVSGIDLMMIIVMGCLQIKLNKLSVGMLYAFIFYRQQFTESAFTLIDKLNDFKMIFFHLHRLSDIFLEKKEFEKNKKNLLLFPIHTLEVRSICFEYDNKKSVLDHFRLKVYSSQFIIIQSPSGSGKTTLFKLLMGLLTPTQGEILINGINLKEISLSDYRQTIAAVMQEDILFSGTLSENITLFSPSPDLQKIEEAAQHAQIHDDIQKLPMQYHTPLNPSGTLLSGGQKQRILIARALYTNPEILFLDEATSQLDNHQEKLIYEKLKSLPIIKMVISHRKNVLHFADQIINL